MLGWRREKGREKKWTANLEPASTQESKKFVRSHINSGELNHCTRRLRDELNRMLQPIMS